MILFAIAALITVGLSWCLTGIVMSSAPKKKLDPGLILLVGSLVTLAVCGGVMAFTVYPPCSASVLWLTCGTYFTSGFLNLIMLLLMSAAMQRGPNGVIWSMIQSGLIFPFLVGIVFFGVELTFARGAGLFLIVVAIILFGTKGNDGAGRGKWLTLTLIAFFITGMQQTLSNLPSYYESAEAVPSILRTFSTGLGVAVATVVSRMYTLNRAKLALMFANLKRRELWSYVLLLQGFGFLGTWLLLYPGMDYLAQAGAGAVAYPLMVGSCIVGFSLYAIFAMHEKCSGLQWTALAAGSTGIACLCF